MRLYKGYNYIQDSFRTDKSQKYTVWFDEPEKKLPLRAASIEAAKRIRASTTKEIVVLYSGGLDSEWILESFVAAGIQVTPLIIRYKDGLNDHDIYWADRYLRSRPQLKHVLWDDHDLKAWYGSKEQMEIAWNSQSPELAYTGQYASILKHNDGHRFFITGYDEPVIQADDSGIERAWNLVYNERHYSSQKLFTHYNIPGPAGGFIDSEVLFGYATCPVWQMLVSNLYAPIHWNSELLKIYIYKAAFPSMEARPKYTGFENTLGTVVEGAKDWQNYLQKNLDYKWLDDWSMPVKEVWKNLGFIRNIT